MHHFQPISFDLGDYCPLEILLQEVQKDVKLSTHDLTHLVYLQNVTFPSDEVLSSESPSLVGSFVCPSVICCIHVLGQQVAVTVGQDGDPSGRLILGLLVPLGSTSRTTGVVAAIVVGASGTSVTSLS